MDAQIRTAGGAGALAGILTLILSSFSQAQVTPTPGAGSLNTQVSKAGNVYEITQGTRAGSNLFHSFDAFSVAAVETARFQTTNLIADATIGNVLGRVTGRTLSSIFGSIDSAAFYPNANLFLMNPAGFLFGPNATVNVGGMVAFTTADYLRLDEIGGPNAGIFHADPAQTSVLTSAPVAAFGFLGSNPGAITVQGSQFTVSEGQAISLVGGNITIEAGTLDDSTIQPARLAAPGGQINLASVASPGEVLATNFMPEAGMTRGTITLSQGSTLDVSGDAAGTIKIRGGQFMIADATLMANTGNTNGAPTAIDINVTGDMSITDTRALPAITARATGAGNAGKVNIESANLEASSTQQTNFVLIDTHTSDAGVAGEAYITTGNLRVTGPNTTQFRFIDSGTRAQGTGNDATINAANIDLNWTTISTGDFVGRTLFLEPSGSAGNLTISADSFKGANFIFSTEAFGAFSETQRGGDITITGRENTPATINLLNGTMAAGGMERGGAIGVTNIESLVADFTFFETFTVFGPGGGITANGRIIELTNGSSFNSSTFGDGQAGSISVMGTDHVSLLGLTGPNPLGIHRPSGLFSNSFGDLGSFGGSGDTFVMTPRLTMNEGRINTSTATSGRGGNVTVVADTVTMSGEFPNPQFQGNPIFTITDIPPSGIFTETVGSDFCSGPCGSAGNIIANIGSLVMGPGSQLNSGTTNNGQGGAITINASNTISMSGTLSDGSPVGIFSRTVGTDPGSGNGGTIDLHAGQFEVTNGAQISASTLGPGNAGHVMLQGPSSPAQSILISGAGSGIFTDTQGTGAGGNLFVNANSVTVQNGGTLSASTSGPAATATGGTITVEAGQVNLNNGGLITAATTGAGTGGSIMIGAGSTFASNASTVSSTASQAQGGDISITAGQSVSLNSGSLITASSSGPGNAGNIVINAGQNYTSTNSSVTTQAAQASGGNITVLATDTVQLTNSQLNASVLGSSTTVGGNIVIDPQFVILQNSQILAQATQGQGGNISITTNVFLPDSLSIVDASSQTGINGNVNVQSPTSQAGGKIVPLSKTTLETTALLSQRCAALASGQFSSFVVAGRDTLPTEPGGWLASPLAALSVESGLVTEGDAITRDRLALADDLLTGAVSLRRTLWGGMLSQVFAVDWTGCES